MLVEHTTDEQDNLLSDSGLSRHRDVLQLVWHERILVMEEHGSAEQTGESLARQGKGVLGCTGTPR
jgi:hypothetical protein